mmetsp:Transcript_4778/g.8210  ORF Transcript_4778/g.8210 Transcript_4778/m.8210 type:complete len:523 (+) Transcript_4778:83-1651(+)
MLQRVCRKLFQVTPEYVEELKSWWAIVWPAWAQAGFMFSMDFTDAAVLGHYKGGDYLPEASSAVLIISLTMSLIQRGPSGAVLTLSSNAYASGQTELAGRRLQAASAMVALICLLVSPLWFWAGDVLYAIAHTTEQRPAVVDEFGRVRLLGVFATGQATVLMQWMVGRGQTRPGMYASMGASILNLLFNFGFIYGIPGLISGLGYVGSPIATALSRWVNFLILLYWAWPELRQCWPAGVWQSFTPTRLGDFLKLALPLTLSTMLEDLNMEITGVMALKFGRQKLATHNSMLSAFLLLSTAMMGFIDGLQSRVSHHMVTGNLDGFRRVVRISSRCMLLWSFVVMICFVSVQDNTGKLFSSNPEVWLLSGQLSFLVGGAYFVMSFFYLSMGILSGIAKPGVVVLGFFLGCYVLGLPVAYLLGFEMDPHKLDFWPYFDPDTASGQEPTGCGILGLWMGLATGYLVTTIVAMSRLLCIKDWSVEVAKARALAELEPTTSQPAASMTTGLMDDGPPGSSDCQQAQHG